MPGGGILVMVPIFEQYLHYTPGMAYVLVALYVVFDPILAFLNVLGNGAFTFSFCQVYDKVLNRRSTREGNKDDGPAAETV
ncbi:hypothetical protein [Anaplasma platys]|uniref:hypothetical protein n=1 Tax=Anaplasma platys TaxID=949 RepID=UPI00145C4834|nr:hypothetical protein [Anaplasma platys]